MSRKTIICGILVLVVLSGIYLFNRTERDMGPAVDATVNSTIESVNISLFSPDDRPANSIQLDVDGPYRLDVSGTFIGPDIDDFILIAARNVLFNLEITQGDQVVWTNSTNKLEPVGTNGFSFSRKFKLPQNLPPGSYMVKCNYYRTNVASKIIQVVK
jgi:hypothetical protein